MDSVSGLVSLVVCVIVEGVLEVDEADLAVCIVLDFDVDCLGVDTGKRRRGVEVVVVGTCANLAKSVGACSRASRSAACTAEMRSIDSSSSVGRDSSSSVGRAVWTRETASCACLGTFCGWRGRWKILLFSTNVLSSSAVTPSRFSRRGEGAREGQRTLR